MVKNLTNEEWRPVVGFEGLYEVSNMGRVKSLNYNGAKGKEHLLHQYEVGGSNREYFQVSLYNKGNKKIRYVHTLVAQAFIPNPHNLPCVNHKDECKHNNHADNIEWCTYYYNVHYGTAIQRKCKKVRQYDLNGYFIREWDSSIQIEEELGISRYSVRKCCQKKLPHVRGYIWKYAK